MIAGSSGSVADLGEWGVIAALAARMPPGPLTSVGIGDDAAVVGAPSGNVVAAVDLLLEGRHFLRSWSSAYDIGVKAAARSLADIAAMGAVPTALLVALAAPGTLPAQWALDLASGLAFEAGRAGAGVVGGDTARADSVLLSVTALGDLAGRPPVRRAGASPGDVVAVAGPLGHSAAGYALLAAGVTAHPGTAALSDAASPTDAAPAADAAAPADAAALADLVAAHLRPAPAYDAGPEAAILGATAMIDISDGLIADLGHVAEASGVWIDIDSSALALGGPLAEAAAAIAAGGSRLSRTKGPVSPAALPREWALTGGEDHSLAATFPPSAALPPRWRVIGTVRPAADAPAGAPVSTASAPAPAPPPGTSSAPAPGTAPATTPRAGFSVTVDGAPYHERGGWEHFR